MGKIILNQVFHTEDGKQTFKWVKESEVEATGGFITNIGGQVKAFMDGEEVPVPARLLNEVDTPYIYVANLKEFAAFMARKHGVYTATKTGKIRVFPNAKAEDIKSIINSVQEAGGLEVDEDHVLVQNVIGGECYVQSKEYLRKNYSFVRQEGMAEIYDFKPAEQQWVYVDVNIYTALWGGIQFLATPMLRVDNPDDIYGCNYIRFWGDDATPGTHRIISFHRACGTKFYSSPLTLPIGYLEAGVEPPKILKAV